MGKSKKAKFTARDSFTKDKTGGEGFEIECQPGIRELGLSISSYLRLKGLLQAIGANLQGAEKAAWIGLSALGFLSYPIGQIKYTTEKEIADLLGAEEDVLISTIEKAQARKVVRMIDKAIVPCKVEWVDDPDIPGEKSLVYNPWEEQFWARYKGLVFLDKLFPHNEDLNLESLPEEIPISKRPPVEMPECSYLYEGEQRNADRDLLEDNDMGLALWKEDREDLSRRLKRVQNILCEILDGSFSPELTAEVAGLGK